MPVAIVVTKVDTFLVRIGSSQQADTVTRYDKVGGKLQQTQVKACLHPGTQS